MNDDLRKKLLTGTKQWLKALPFISIGLILMGTFVFYPLIRNIQISFSEFNIISNSVGESVGFDNYINMFKDPQYLKALMNTVLYALVTVPGQMILGLILAHLINKAAKGKTVFKVIVYLPVVTSWVVISHIFRYIFSSGNGGLINYCLMNLGIIKEPVAWLQNEWTAKVVLWIFGIWKGIGWTMVIYLAALQNIPFQVFEAAQIDGANSIKVFTRIIVPLVKNASLYLTVVLLIGAFGAYIHVMLITEGGPLGRTNQLMNYMYNTAFSEWNFSYAAAQAVMMGIIVFVMSFVQRKVIKETVN